MIKTYQNMTQWLNVVSILMDCPSHEIMNLFLYKQWGMKKSLSFDSLKFACLVYYLPL